MLAMGSYFVDSIRLPAGPRIETLILCLRSRQQLFLAFSAIQDEVSDPSGETSPSDRISINFAIRSKIIADKVDTSPNLSSFNRYEHLIKLQGGTVARLLCGEFQKTVFDWKVLSAGCTSHVEICGGDLN